MLLLEKEADLEGLPDSLKSAAANAAESRGQKGKWAVLNTRSSMEPFLTYSARRDLREKVWRTYYDRGNNGDAHDTKKIIPEILELRAERAKLLGFATHAHWRLDDTMAKTPERTLEAHAGVWVPPSSASTRKSPTCRRSPTPRARRSRSSPGTIATTPRRCARRSTTST
jgi:peptidyl-dipeptidase Dcp